MLLLGFKLSCGKSVKYRYIEFFAFDYDSLPISFQSGIAVSFSSSIKSLVLVLRFGLLEHSFVSSFITGHFVICTLDMRDH